MGESTKMVTRYGYVVDTEELHAFGVAEQMRAFARAKTGSGFYVTAKPNDEDKAKKVYWIDKNNNPPTDELKALRDLNNGNEKRNKGFTVTTAYTDGKACRDKKALEEYDFENWYLDKDGDAVCIKMRFVVLEMV